MIDDLLKKINEVIDSEEGEKGQDGTTSGNTTHINVGNITGDNNTVIIGDHPRRRQEDREDGGGSHGRRASDRALHQELRSLRHQVRNLRQLVQCLYARCTGTPFKGSINGCCTAAPDSKSKCHKRPESRRVSNWHPPAFADRQAAESRATRGLRSHQPTPTHINPLISFLLAPNSSDPSISDASI